METGRNFAMLNLCGIVVAILKMATSKKISMSGINSGHHNLPTCEISLKSDNVEFVRYCGDHFLCRVLAAILKMADILNILKCRIAPLMVTYHYVKFYVSIIIHLEVISQC